LLLQHDAQLGKIQDPVDDKVKKDLQSVQIMIDVLLMLHDKTKVTKKVRNVNLIDFRFTNHL
jgi:hypothetical protein